MTNGLDADPVSTECPYSLAMPPRDDGALDEDEKLVI